MQKKCGKWLADWRDEKGRRHRKAFKTAAHAAAHASRMEAKVRRQRVLLAIVHSELFARRHCVAPDFVRGARKLD